MRLNSRNNGSSGFTLLEIMIVTALVALLSAIALPTYRGVIERLQEQQASSDMMSIVLLVKKRRDGDGRLPATLDGIPGVPAQDPWGRPYVYNNFDRPGFNRGQVRKDRNLVPINTEFDLYSMGKDGESRPPLTARPSRDDIVMARDGAFIGIAEDF